MFTTWCLAPFSVWLSEFPNYTEGKVLENVFLFFFKLFIFHDSPCAHIYLENSYSLFKSVLVYHRLSKKPSETSPRESVLAVYSHKHLLSYFTGNCLMVSNWKSHFNKRWRGIDSQKSKEGLKK